MHQFKKEAQSPGVLVRDFILFYIKLLVDGAKDLVLVHVALFAFLLDLILMILFGRKRSFFYRVLELGERFDLYLNLYTPAQGAAHDPDGLFGQSRAGDATFLGEMEELVRRGPEPPPARPAGSSPAMAGAPRPR